MQALGHLFEATTSESNTMIMVAIDSSKRPPTHLIFFVLKTLFLCPPPQISFQLKLMRPISVIYDQVYSILYNIKYCLYYGE
jgi:hypothetical protein